MGHVLPTKRRRVAGGEASVSNIDQRVRKLEQEVALLSLSEKLDQLFRRVAQLEAQTLDA